MKIIFKGTLFDFKLTEKLIGDIIYLVTFSY